MKMVLNICIISLEVMFSSLYILNYKSYTVKKRNKIHFMTNVKYEKCWVKYIG